MRKVLLGTFLFVMMLAVPMPAKAEVSIGISISLPPPMVLSEPPELIVLPNSYVYVAPDMDEDLYFYNGWWWRPWGGHWYRSRSYGSGWSYYRNVPSFYRGIPSGWRHDYREHRWQGRPWDHQRIPHQQLHQNWKSWEKNRYWEKQQNWGVQGLHSQPRSQHPYREMEPRQHRPPSREVTPQRSRQQGYPQEMQTRPLRPQTRENRSERPQYPNNPERGQDLQRDHRDGLQPAAQEIQSRHPRPQTREADSRRSHKKDGNPDLGEEEQQRRR